MDKIADQIDSLVRDAVFSDDPGVKEKSRKAIREAASSRGLYAASIQGLYEAAGMGVYKGITVPAINIR